MVLKFDQFSSDVLIGQMAQPTATAPQPLHCAVHQECGPTVLQGEKRSTYEQILIPPIRQRCSGSQLEHFQKYVLDGFSRSLVLLTPPQIHAAYPPPALSIYPSQPSLTNRINLPLFFLFK